MPRLVLPDHETYGVYGFDIGSTNLGISEMELRYKWTEESFFTLAKLHDFYAMKMHSGAGWDFQRRVLWIGQTFREMFPHVDRVGHPMVAYLEIPPKARSMTTFSQLHQLYGVIAFTLLDKGWAVNGVNVSTWKKEVIGHGWAKKEDIRAWATGGNVPADPDEMNEDNIDALAICYYGISRLANQLRHDITNLRGYQKIMFE